MSEFHLIATFAIILLTMVAFASDKYSIEAVSIGSLCAFLVIFGMFPLLLPNGRLLSADALLSGFGNPALATVIALLIVGQGLFATDALEAPARYLGRFGGNNPRLTIAITG